MRLCMLFRVLFLISLLCCGWIFIFLGIRAITYFINSCWSAVFIVRLFLFVLFLFSVWLSINRWIGLKFVARFEKVRCWIALNYPVILRAHYCLVLDNRRKLISGDCTSINNCKLASINGLCILVVRHTRGKKAARGSSLLLQWGDAFFTLKLKMLIRFNLQIQCSWGSLWKFIH